MIQRRSDVTGDLIGRHATISARMMMTAWSVMYHQLLNYSYTLTRNRKRFVPRASHNRSKPVSMNHKCWLPTSIKGRNYTQSVAANWEVVYLLPHIEINNAQTTNKFRTVSLLQKTWQRTRHDLSEDTLHYTASCSLACPRKTLLQENGYVSGSVKHCVMVRSSYCEFILQIWILKRQRPRRGLDV